MVTTQLPVSLPTHLSHFLTSISTRRKAQLRSLSLDRHLFQLPVAANDGNDELAPENAVDFVEAASILSSVSIFFAIVLADTDVVVVVVIAALVDLVNAEIALLT